jgi:hypothetical protein
MSARPVRPTVGRRGGGGKSARPDGVTHLETAPRCTPDSILPASGDGEREPAEQPNDLGRLFLERANASDVDGLVALYHPGAVLALPPGQVTTGSQAIRHAYQRLLSDRPTFAAGEQQPALRFGDLALHPRPARAARQRNP